MPTLYVDNRFCVDSSNDPIDGPGCHMVVEILPGVSKGWVTHVGSDGTRRRLQPDRESYLPGPGRRQRTFANLDPGTYQAHSALTETTAVLIGFEVMDGDFVLRSLWFNGPDGIGLLQRSFRDSDADLRFSDQESRIRRRMPNSQKTMFEENPA